MTDIKTIIIFFLLFFVKIAFCQMDSSRALVYFKEKGVVIYLNDEKTEPQKVLKKMAVGKYKVKVWAPHYELMLDSFLVLKNENKFYTKKLHFTEDYKSYRRNQNAFKLTYIIPAAASLISGLSYYSEYNNINKDIDKSYTLALYIKSDYDKGHFLDKDKEYYAEKANYESLIAKQEKLKKQGVIITSACIATTLTFFVIDLVRKRKPYNETSLLSRVKPSYNPLNNQICVIIKL